MEQTFAPEYTPTSEGKEEEEPDYEPFLEDDIAADDYDYGEDFIINYGIVSILPIEFDRVSEVSENEDDFTFDEADNEKPLCYYVINSGVVEEQKDVFEKPSPGILYYLKLLFIRENIDSMPVNKVFVYGGEAVNLIPHALLRKWGSVGQSLDLTTFCFIKL